MAEKREQFLELLTQFQSRNIDRRTFMSRAAALGVSAAAFGALTGARPTLAQDGEGQTSITREEYEAEFAEAYPPDPDAQQGGQFIYGDSTDITTTNLMVSNNAPTNPVLALINESLYGSSPIDGSYVPALADYWEISADGLTYTFYLNQEATWHDGEAFDVNDVILSFDAQSNPDTGSSYTSTFNNIVGSYEALDEHTFQVTVNEVFAPIVTLGNMYAPIMPEHIWGDTEFSAWTSDPGSTGADPGRVVGTGPFVFQEWVQGERFIATRNDDYHGDVANIDEFIFQVYPEDIAAVEALRAGATDAYHNPAAAEVESLRAEPDLDVEVYDTFAFGFYGYNLDPEKTTIFEDVRTRQGLFVAIDRQSIVDNISLGLAEVAQGTQPVLSLAYAPDEIRTRYDFDPERAAALLEEAGWVDRDGDGIRELEDGTRLEWELMYPTGNPATDQQVAYLQDVWADVGANCILNGVDFSTVLVPAITDTYDYEMVILGFSWDATGDQSAMFSTDAYGGGFNFMRYSNPEYDELANQANVELDEDRRRELLIEASNIANDDLPVGIISFRQDRMAYNSTRVQNFFPNALGGDLWPVPYLWISE